MDLLLWPMAYTLRYCGFDIAEPVAAHSVHGYFQGADQQALKQRLVAVLDGQHDLIANLDTRKLWQFNADSDFDDQGRLKPDADRIWPFIS